MESTTMGRVVIEAKIENFGDIWAVMQGIQTADQIRLATRSSPRRFKALRQMKICVAPRLGAQTIVGCNAGALPAELNFDGVVGLSLAP